MKILITAGSVMTQEGHFTSGDEPNHITDELKRHLVEIGSAAITDSDPVIDDYKPKKKALSSQSLPQAKVSQRKTRKPRTSKPKR